MQLKDLEQLIATLAKLPETDAPVVSCYLNLGGAAPDWHRLSCHARHALRSALPAAARLDFDQAMLRIEAFLRSAPLAGAAGLALFARAGDRPLFLPLWFKVPLPDSITAGSAPNIYCLAELRDNYHRYVILHSTEEGARILGVNLGSVTEEVRKSRPRLRDRTGHEWSKQNLNDHARERNHQFVLKQVRGLEQTMAGGVYRHLILTGSERMTAAVRKALPRHLAERLIAVLTNVGAGSNAALVSATLPLFLEYEESESRRIVEQLEERIGTSGAAVTGAIESMHALSHGQGDVLVLASGYDPGPGWGCRACGAVELGAAPVCCPRCRNNRVRRFETRGELVRLAERTGCRVEVVNESDTLMRVGGVGCLLRFAVPLAMAAHSAA